MLFEFIKENHTYKLDGIVIPSVTQVIKEAGLINLDYVNDEYIKYKADLGEKVHSTTELFDQNNLDEESLHPTLKAYLEGWKKFRTDYEFNPTHIEYEAYHSLYRYAGRIDRVGTIKLNRKKLLAIIDIKTGIIHHSHAIQTAAYMELFNQSRIKSEQAKTRICVYLKENGGYEIKEYKDDNAKNIFLACLTIYNYKKNNM